MAELVDKKPRKKKDFSYLGNPKDRIKSIKNLSSSHLGDGNSVLEAIKNGSYPNDSQEPQYLYESANDNLQPAPVEDTDGGATAINGTDRQTSPVNQPKMAGDNPTVMSGLLNAIGIEPESQDKLGETISRIGDNFKDEANFVKGIISNNPAESIANTVPLVVKLTKPVEVLKTVNNTIEATMLPLEAGNIIAEQNPFTDFMAKNVNKVFEAYDTLQNQTYELERNGQQPPEQLKEAQAEFDKLRKNVEMLMLGEGIGRAFKLKMKPLSDKMGITDPAKIIANDGNMYSQKTIEKFANEYEIKAGKIEEALLKKEIPKTGEPLTPEQIVELKTVLPELEAKAKEYKDLLPKQEIKNNVDETTTPTNTIENKPVEVEKPLIEKPIEQVPIDKVKNLTNIDKTEIVKSDEPIVKQELSGTVNNEIIKPLEADKPNLLNSLKTKTDFNVRDLSIETGRSPRDISAQLRKLSDKKLIERNGKGYKATEDLKIVLEDIEKAPEKYGTTHGKLYSNPINEYLNIVTKVDDIWKKYAGDKLYELGGKALNKIVPEKLKEWTVTNYGKPKEYIELKRQADAEIQSYRELAQELGNSLKYREGKTEFSRPEQVRLQQMVRGSVAPPESVIKPETKTLRDRATKVINEIKDLERQGKQLQVLPIETYNTKLPRRRIAELLKEKTDKERQVSKIVERYGEDAINIPAYKKLQNEIQIADSKVKNSFKKGGEGYFKRVYLSKELEAKFNKFGLSKPTRLDLTSAIHRQDIPLDVRIKMQEVLTASYPVTKSILLEGKDVSLGRFFEAVSENPSWADVIERDGFVKMADSPKLGKLKDMFVEKSIADDLNDVIKYSSEDYVNSFIKEITSIWKATKTILSPSTQVRNLASNTVLLDMSGTPHAIQMEILPEAIKTLRGNGKYTRELQLSGLKGSTFNQAELGKFLDAVEQIGKGENGNGFKNFMALDFPDKLLKAYGKVSLVDTKLGKTMGNLYQGSEVLFKAIKFIHERQKGKSLIDARNEANKWLFNYNEIPKTVRTLRENALGVPFITWSYKALPRMIESAITRPLSFWKYPAIFSAITKLSLDQLDLNEDDWVKLRDSLPSRIKNGQFMLIPFRDENGNLQTFDVSYLMPYSTLFDMSMAGYSLATTGQLRDGSDAVNSVFDFISNPVASTVIELSTNKSRYNDQPIWNETDKPTEKLQKTFDYLYKMYMPSLFPEIPGLTRGGYAYDKLRGSITQRPDYYNRVMGVTPAITSSLLGMKTNPIEYSKNINKQLSTVEEKISELNQKKGTLLKDNSKTEGNRLTEAQEFDAKLNELKSQRKSLEKEAEPVSVEGKYLEKKIKALQIGLSYLPKDQQTEEQNKINKLKITLDKLKDERFNTNQSDLKEIKEKIQKGIDLNKELTIVKKALTKAENLNDIDKIEQLKGFVESLKAIARTKDKNSSVINFDVEVYLKSNSNSTKKKTNTDWLDELNP